MGYDQKVSAVVAQRWARRVERWQRRLQPRLPDVPAEDLALTLASILRPKQVPRRFLKQTGATLEPYTVVAKQALTLLRRTPSGWVRTRTR